MLTSHLAIWIFLFSQTYKKLKCNKSLIIRFLCKAIYNIPLFNSKVHINSEISIWYHLSLYLLPSLLSFLLIPSFPPPSFSFSLDKENRVNHRRFLLIWNKNFFLTYVDESVQFLVGTHNLIWISPLDIGKCKPTKGTKKKSYISVLYQFFKVNFEFFFRKDFSSWGFWPLVLMTILFLLKSWTYWW